MTLVSAFGVNGNGATGPASSISFGGAFVAGLAFKVTSTGQQLNGYYVWRSDSAQSASVTCALWALTSNSAGTFQAGTSVSSSSLVAGQWNFLPLATPFPLTSGTTYRAVYGLTGNFNDTANQFGTGGPYSAGIVNGPLTVFSAPVAQGGTNQAPFTNVFQGVFGTSGSDPTVNLPASDDHMSNFWVDIQIGPASSTISGAATLGAAGSLSAPASTGAAGALAGAGQIGTPAASQGAGTVLGAAGAVTAAAGQAAGTVLGAAGTVGAAPDAAGPAGLGGQGQLAAPAAKGAGAALGAAGSLAAAPGGQQGAVLAGRGLLAGPAAIQAAAAVLAAAGSIAGAGGSPAVTQGAAVLAAAGFLAATQAALYGTSRAGQPAAPQARAGVPGVGSARAGAPQAAGGGTARAGTWP